MKKQFKDLTPRDHELNDGFLQRELSATFRLCMTDHSFEIQEEDSNGRLALNRIVEDVANRTLAALRGLAFQSDLPAEDMPYLDFTLRYFDLEDAPDQIGTTLKISAGDLLTPENIEAAVKKCIADALPRFEQALEALDVILQ